MYIFSVKYNIGEVAMGKCAGRFPGHLLLTYQTFKRTLVIAENLDILQSCNKILKRKM